MEKFTKITASIGPNSQDKKVLKEMIEAGVNMCRLNFSHDTGDVQGEKVDTIRQISKELDRPVAIVCDLQGPKHRIGNFETEDHYPLEKGQIFVLDSDSTPGNSQRVQLPHPEVLASLNVGERVLLNDGKIELKVEKLEAGRVETSVIRGNEIWSRRGFNLPDTEVATSVLTEKDRADLEYCLTKNPDYVAISFVQKPEDVIETREFIKARTNRPVKILAKIERPNAVERISEIVKEADAIMVARGDLAVEMAFEYLPAVQRKIIREARKYNKPVIVATQMLGSMVESEFPTRAEISDVAIAAYLRADSTMTSEETTVGINPVKVIETMSRILRVAEKDAEENGQYLSKEEHLPENRWSHSIVHMARLNYVSAIIVFAHDTIEATEISCRRTDIPIIAVCKEEVYANQLALSRSVYPIFDEKLFADKDAFAAARKFSIESGNLIIVENDKVSLRSF